MQDNRPRNIGLTDLMAIKLPITSYSSILHRISGVLLFLLIPVMLSLLDRSLDSPESFAALQADLGSGFSKFILWVILSAFLYHIVAGVRHLIMDMGYGETLEGGQRGAWAVLVISAVLILLGGVWIW